MARKRKPAGKLHPFVDAMINTSKTAGVILGEHPDFKSAMFDAMRGLRNVLAGELSSMEAIDRAGKASIEGEDPLAAAIFCWMWAMVSRQSRRVAECSALLTRARGLLPADAPPEMEGFQLEQEGDLAATVGDMAKAGQLYGQVLSVVPASSPKRVFFLAQYAQFLAPLWRLSEIEAEAETLIRRDPARYAAVLAVPRLLHSMEMCDAAGLREATALMERNEVSRTRQYGLLVLSRQLVSLLEGGSLLPGTETETGVFRDIADLMAGKPEAALACIRDYLTRDLDAYLNGNQFMAFNLLRAELACGHGEAARRVIDIRHRRGNFHPLDDFFLARAELLAGNRARAAGLFRTTLDVIDRCGAQRRLDFELRMAGELSPADVLWLTRATVAASAKAGDSAPAIAKSRPEIVGAARLLGSSAAMAGVREHLRRLAALDVPVLIVGETGTGKELAARALHEAGPRAGRPFVAINCGAIVESLLESELFGHERGAFTGAAGAHRGVFEQAGEGTLLLDEVGEIAPRLQVALLRVLEAGEVRPVGASRARSFSCRVAAATNASLDRLVADGRFRQDLLYRLRRIEIRMPSLRERREDVLPLAEHFLGEGRVDGLTPRMSAALRSELLRRDWPGNVRELRNVIERMRLLNSEKLDYDVTDLESPKGKEPGGPPPTGDGPAPAQPRPLRSTFRRLEAVRELFRKGEPLTGSEIAAHLGVSRNTVTTYLRTLRDEGLIDKIEPTASPRTHYFRLRPAPPENT